MLALLKDTTEYGDMDDDQIQNLAIRSAMKSPVSANVSVKSRQTAKSVGHESAQGGGGGDARSSKEAKNNDWIPTQAVRAILQIRD